MRSVRLKICGVMTPACAETAAAAGAHAIGMILSPARRQITPARAREVMAAVPPFVAAVGVFVDAPVDHVAVLARDLGLSAVQLHGHESPEDCLALQRQGLTVIKALHVADRVDSDLVVRYSMASAVLLDTRVEGIAGGTGQAFPWEVAAGLARDHRIIVAGGLTPENVHRALDVLNPYGVDVTSGVETAGIKDPHKVRAFVEQVRAWEQGA